MEETSKKREGFHYQNAKSVQMQKLIRFMSDYKEHTTKEIGDATDICAVSTALCALRKNNYRVSGAKYVRKTETGAKVFSYQMLPF